MLVSPLAGVDGVHADDRHAASGGHTGQPIPEPSGGDAGDGAAQAFCAFPAAQGLAPGGPRVSEVEVLHHDRRTVVLLGVVKHGGDRGAHPPVPV